MSYVTFCHVGEFRVDCIIHAIDPDKIPATIAWLKGKGATDIETDVEVRATSGFGHYVQFHHESHDFYRLLDRERPNPYQPVRRVPAPSEESTLIQDKFLWRQIVRPITGKNSTPVTLDRSNLPALREAKRNLCEFASSSYSEGRFHYSGIKEDDIAPALDDAISKIERLGCCCVID
jgi:hypothetical protein